MYHEHIHSPDQALVHLAFHCCLRDGELKKEELDYIATTFVAKGLQHSLDLKNEMKAYHTYQPFIKDETVYLGSLLDTIQPRYKLALFAFCAEIVFRDRRISISEEVMLGQIASLLYIRENESAVVQRLLSEMNAVESQNAF